YSRRRAQLKGEEMLAMNSGVRELCSHVSTVVGDIERKRRQKEEKERKKKEREERKRTQQIDNIKDLDEEEDLGDDDGTPLSPSGKLGGQPLTPRQQSEKVWQSAENAQKTFIISRAFFKLRINALTSSYRRHVMSIERDVASLEDQLSDLTSSLSLTHFSSLHKLAFIHRKLGRVQAETVSLREQLQEHKRVQHALATLRAGKQRRMSSLVNELQRLQRWAKVDADALLREVANIETQVEEMETVRDEMEQRVIEEESRAKEKRKQIQQQVKKVKKMKSDAIVAAQRLRSDVDSRMEKKLKTRVSTTALSIRPEVFSSMGPPRIQSSLADMQFMRNKEKTL
ncbi:hypothetical protein ADUPG1_007354, partial [Aduncisulcus paluster]